MIKKTVTYDKRTVTYNKKRTDAMLVLLNITMEPSNLRKKIKELLGGTVPLLFFRGTIELLNYIGWILS